MDASWYRTLGARIARLRARAGYTQEQLAERAGIGASYVARIETGLRRPTLDVVGNLASALDVPLHRLFADDRAIKAAEAKDGWGKSSRALLRLLGDLDEPDVDLLLRVAHRLRHA